MGLFEILNSFIGTAGGANCMFWFKYNGQWYDECITGGQGDGSRAWCSTTAEYNGVWGYCVTGTLVSSAQNVSCY